LLSSTRNCRPGEPPFGEVCAAASATSRFLRFKRYDLGRVGPLQDHKKLPAGRFLIAVTKPFHLRRMCLSTIDYLINLELDVAGAFPDDSTTSANRVMRSGGRTAQTRFRVGLNRLERIIKSDDVRRDRIAHPLPSWSTQSLGGGDQGVFGSSQLSQLHGSDQPPLAETHPQAADQRPRPRRPTPVSGPGCVRDIHPSRLRGSVRYETPEVRNAGLIGSLATHARGE